MLWVSKIKEGAKSVIKEHPFSVYSFFISFVFAGIMTFEYDLKFPVSVKMVLTFCQNFFLSITAAFALIEANFLYRKKKGEVESILDAKKNSPYILILVLGLLNSVIYSLFRVKSYTSVKEIFGMNGYDAEEVFLQFFYVYIAVFILGTIYYLYKKSSDELELYALKGFLGSLKGYLAYGVITLGTLCIVFVFNTLIKEVDIIQFILCIISGLMAYTTVLLALSRPGEKISGFGKVMMGYVFPGILLAAFVIVYIYILKILITWSFPSNEAFTIVTALFASGICIWTMAQGCTEGRLYYALRIFPLLYIPFIVIQIMCLYMRVHQYGLTSSRYLGILLIIFEALYEIYYIVRLRAAKGIGGVVFPVLIAFVLVYFLVPGINVYASVTASQKRVVDKVVAELNRGATPKSEDIARARSAYSQIDKEGGIEGTKYLNRLYETMSKDELEQAFYNGELHESLNEKYIYASKEWALYDIASYSVMGIVDISIYDDSIDMTDLPLYNGSTSEAFARADLSDLVRDLEELEERDAETYEFNMLLDAPVRVSEGAVLLIENISFDENEYGQISDLNLRGIYLGN